MNQVIEAQRERDPGRISFDVPDESLQEQERYAWEARPLVAFAYYEMSTVVSLLGKGFRPLPAHLEYLVGVRHKILAHPCRAAFIKNSSLEVTIGPVLLPHLIGADSWDPLVRGWYLKKLKDAGGWLEEDEGVAANTHLLRSKVKVKEFTLIDRLRLKSYSIREPDLLQSAVEMADMLRVRFVPRIEDACRPATRA